ncbi:MAG: hypothetical protein JWN70_1277 [Planctomycetaceae bacterium]|nr:hypothetical protein [Planctomycetaceae bacterium]
MTELIGSHEIAHETTHRSGSVRAIAEVSIRYSQITWAEVESFQYAIQDVGSSNGVMTFCHECFVSGRVDDGFESRTGSVVDQTFQF